MALDHLYRFRSTQALLDGYQELEAQQIYFSPPDKLNDPLEGFKDIFWRGDSIVWRNLLRHYLLNLMQAASISAVMGQEFDPGMCAQLVHQTDDDLPQAPIRSVYGVACKEFFGHPAPERLISALATQERAVRRDELVFHLRLLHPLAARCVFSALGDRLVQVQAMHELDALITGMSQKLEDFFDANARAGDLAEGLFSVSEQIMSQLALIQEFHNPVGENRRSWLFINRDFPSNYVAILERLLYPDWHVACFVADPTNASMWGTYADSHKGACLKFRTRNDSQGNPTLDLYRIASWSGGRNGVVENYAYVPHGFEDVRYTAEFPEVDFFESIATLPRFKLDGFWFAGQNGESSTTALRMRREDETWRQEYWRKFAASFSTKSPEWRHEEERRLILYSHMQRFDEQESRKLKYRFADLEGIIFGIKTTSEDKLQIMRIIGQKCAAENRRDFEFFQAYYSNRTKKIELAPLTMLKVN